MYFLDLEQCVIEEHLKSCLEMNDVLLKTLFLWSDR